MPPGDVLPFLVIMTFVVSGAAVLVLRGPLGKALARRLEGRSGLDDGLREELEELRARTAEAEVLAARLAELEERVDFSERMLVRARATEAGHEAIDR